MELRVTKGRILRFGAGRCRCALGHGGRTADKHEGDGATPVGWFTLRRVLYRADRVPRPLTGLPARALTPRDGWCDDAASRDYNRPVRLPVAAGHERLWRHDHLYDLIVVLGHNDAPVRPRRGSAIFLHIAAPDFAPTEGCVAIEAHLLARILRRCGPNSRIHIEGGV